MATTIVRTITIKPTKITAKQKRNNNNKNNNNSIQLSALPIKYGSSIFVRVLENKVNNLRVLIIGPEYTPYVNDCFFFDVTLGYDYPNKPFKIGF